MTATVEIEEDRSWEFRVERRQENITAEARVTTLHLKPMDVDGAPISSLKMNLIGDPEWARDLTPERAATIIVGFGKTRQTSTLESHDDGEEAA